MLWGSFARGIRVGAPEEAPSGVEPLLHAVQKQEHFMTHMSALPRENTVDAFPSPEHGGTDTEALNIGVRQYVPMYLCTRASIANFDKWKTGGAPCRGTSSSH